MPQLDRIIIFTQIFWLFFIFTFSYIILTHYFFPVFLKSLKARKLVVESNIKEASDLHDQFILNQNLFTKSLNDGLLLVKHVYSPEFLFISTKNSLPLDIIDSKLVKVLLNIMLYCDKTVLNCISLNSRTYNLGCTIKQ